MGFCFGNISVAGILGTWRSKNAAEAVKCRRQPRVPYDFIRGIILGDKHKVCVDLVTALNTAIAGVYAHMSAMKGGECLKIPEVM